jgi:hypothetical protein
MSAKPRTRHGVQAALAVSLSLALTFSLLGGAAQSQSDDPSCTQTQKMIEPGPTTALGHGTTRFTASQVTPSGLGGGTLIWTVKAAITGENTNSDPGNGDLAGYLEWTIDWNQNRPNTAFQSSCVVSVGTEVGVVGATYIGDLTGLPPSNTNTSQGYSLPGYSYLLLERTGTPKVADIRLVADDRTPCIGGQDSLKIERPQANAPGSKQGNGWRQIVCEP